MNYFLNFPHSNCVLTRRKYGEAFLMVKRKDIWSGTSFNEKKLPTRHYSLTISYEPSLRQVLRMVSWTDLCSPLQAHLLLEQSLLSSPATLVALIFPKYGKVTPASGPLHIPGRICSEILKWEQLPMFRSQYVLLWGPFLSTQLRCSSSLPTSITPYHISLCSFFTVLTAIWNHQVCFSLFYCLSSSTKL